MTSNDETIRTVEAHGCPACGARGTQLYAGLRDRLFGTPGEWRVCSCVDRQCGTLWLDPRPADADIEKLYRTYLTHPEYAQYDTDRDGTWTARTLARMYRLVARAASVGQRSDRGLLFLGSTLPGRALEVGCGDGSLLARLRDRGWQVEGQDVDAVAAAGARERHGLVVHLGQLETLALPAASYDAILLSHVVEHLPAPADTLRECGRLLRPEGQVVAVTPNALGLNHRTFGKDWLGLDPPRHLQVFTPKGLSEVARRAGFSRMQVTTCYENTAMFAYASLNLRHDGQLHPSEFRGGRHLLAKALQLRAWAEHLYDPNSGEELVLKAQR